MAQGGVGRDFRFPRKTKVLPRFGHPSSRSVATRPNAFWRLDRQLKPGLERFEKSAIVHILGYVGAVISFAALVAGFIQFWSYLGDRDRELQIMEEERIARAMEREAQEEERYERAWDRLLRKETGEVRKGQALTVLMEAGVDIETLDLSCRAFMSEPRPDNWCTVRYTFDDMRFPGPPDALGFVRNFLISGDPADVSEVADTPPFPITTFTGNRIIRADLSGRMVDAGGVDLLTHINESILHGSLLSLQDGYLAVTDSDLSFSIISFDDVEERRFSTFSSNNLTGTIFAAEEQITDSMRHSRFGPETENDADAPLRPRQGPPAPSFGLGWAWADAPPRSYDIDRREFSPLEPAYLQGINFLDPSCRLGPVENQPMDPVIPANSNGIKPKLSELRTPLASITDPEIETLFACMLGSWTDAARVFPDRYPQFID